MGTITAIRTSTDLDAIPSDAIELPVSTDLPAPPGSSTGTCASDLTVGELEEELTSLAGHINAATCRFLVVLGEFDARDGWAVNGVISCAHWLTWRCGLSTGAAREHVRVARSLRTLPITQAAFAAGRLSFSKVRALTRIASHDREPELVELALVMPSGPLERYLRGVEQSLDAERPSVHPSRPSVHPSAERDAALDDASRRDADAEIRRHGRRSVVWRWDEDGSLVLTARLSPEDGALVVEALEAVRAELQAAESGAPRADELPAPDLGPYQDLQHVPVETSSRRSLADAFVQVFAQAGDPAGTARTRSRTRPDGRSWSSTSPSKT